MIRRLFTRESKSIAGAAFVIGAAAIFSRFLGLIRDRLLVGHFPLDELDAYYAAFQIPNFLFALLVLGTLSASFIPVFTSYYARDMRQEAWRVANAVLGIAMAVMGAACLLLVVFAPWIAQAIAPGFSGEKLELTVRLTRVMMLAPFVFSISAVLSSVLNSRRQFLAVSLAPLLYNASLIFGVLFLARPFGILGVAYGAIIGAVLHMLIQLPAVVASGMPLRPTLEAAHPGVREIGRLFLPRVFGVDISQTALLIGSVIGTTIGSGTVAIYNLASNINGVPLGAVAIPFAIAAFPNLSEAAAKGERGVFIRIFATTMRQVMFFMIPLAALAVVLREHVIRIVIGGQNLPAHDFERAAISFALFAASLPLQGLAPTLARAFYALKNTRVPVLASLSAVAVYATVVWIANDRLGSLALALAFSVASVTQVAILTFILRKFHGRIGGTDLLRGFLKIMAGTSAGVAAAAIVMRLTAGLFDSVRFVDAVLEAGLVTLAAAAGYLLVLKLAKSEELEAILSALHRKIMKVEKPIDGIPGL